MFCIIINIIVIIITVLLLLQFIATRIIIIAIDIISIAYCDKLTDALNYGMLTHKLHGASERTLAYTGCILDI